MPGRTTRRASLQTDTANPVRPDHNEPPAATIDADALRELAEIGCAVDEAAAWLEVDAAVLAEAIAAPPFDAVWARGAARGRVILRRAQFAHALKSPTMAVLLGKLRLGQGEAADGGRALTIIVDTGIERERDDQS